MTNRFEPLRAEPRAIHSVPATPGGLIRSTLLAAGSAGVVLVLFWLPAEYGIDPTGVGRLTGLTEMGEIKQQLAAEAEADAQVAAPALAPELVARLDRIEAQLDAMSLAMTAPTAATPEVAAPPTVAESPPSSLKWRDEVSYTLAPGEGIEVKLVMEAGQTARYEWSANGGVVNFDMHGDGSGQKVSYEQGRAVPELAGELTAAFTGNHGWFWRNRSDTPVTVTLRTSGAYRALHAP